jgi:hypothetical protein
MFFEQLRQHEKGAKALYSSAFSGRKPHFYDFLLNKLINMKNSEFTLIAPPGKLSEMASECAEYSGKDKQSISIRRKNMKKSILTGLAAITLSIGFVLTGCKQEATPPPSLDSPYRVQFSASSATKTLSGLVNQDVYLVRVNKSNVNVDGANIGSVAASSPSSHSQVGQDIAPSLRSLSSARPMMDLPEALAWKPSEAVVQAQRERDALNAAAHNEGGPAHAFVDYVVGTSKNWWVNNPDWAEMLTTLRAQGEHCNVWVANADYYVSGERVAGDVTSADAIALKDKFDLLYPIETKLLGYEFGGGIPSTDANYGGQDRDERIQILVYKSHDPSLGGYFWDKDYYSQDSLNRDPNPLKTNDAEIFYLNSTQIIPSDLSYILNSLPQIIPTADTAQKTHQV